MHDLITYKRPVVIGGKVQKDDQGIVSMTNETIKARVIRESKMVTNQDGQEIQSAFTIFYSGPEPRIGDEIEFESEEVKVLSRKPRQSFSGRKTFYWVLYCGQ